MSLLVALALGQEASTGDRSTATDTQLLRPTFADGAIPGFDVPHFARPGTLRVGTLLQYERDPLLLYKFKEEQGAVVANRDVLDLGLWWQPARRVALRVSLPITAQWGGEVEGLSDDGVGVGNLGAGVALQAWKAGRLSTAGTLDLLLPTSPTTAWVGDAGIRAEGGVLGSFDLGGLMADLEMAASLRAKTDTGYDFRPGSELLVNPALRYQAWPGRVELGTGLLTRWGFTGAAAAPVEWVAGISTHPTRRWQVDAGVGRGLTGGYGTTQLRLFAGVTWHQEPREPEPAPVVAVVSPPTADLTEAEVAPPPEPPADPPLARIERERIVIRDPIQFEFGTDRILPISQPTLEAIQRILDQNPEVLHVVIEGHASEEGSYLYNYHLSLRRSIAIFRALVDMGVHPARLSCRGMGEVVPVAEGADETALAANRRVVFHIVRRLEPGEPYPDWGTERRVPWTGAAEPWSAPVVAPPPEAAPAPASPPPAESFPDFREEEDATPFGTEEEDR